VIFEPWRDGGYPQYLHVSWKHARLDGFHDRGREGSAGWTMTTGLFRTFERGGRPHVSTFAADGDRTTGFASYEFEAARGGTVSFTLHGGHAEVVLVAGSASDPSPSSSPADLYDRLKGGALGTVIEAVRGADSNDADAPIRWSVDRFAGSKLRIMIVDQLTGRWGFVSVSEIEIAGSG
jgi:hypothetical protein